MKYYQDYIAMLDDRFIDAKSFDDLDNHSAYKVEDQIKRLSDDLKIMPYREKEILIKGLKLMSELGCYKSALSASINTAIVYDTKEPDNRYVQVRGSVLFEKKKRVWVGHYVGEEDKFTDENGKLKPGLKRYFRIFVVVKLVDRLKRLAFGTPEGE